jgi:hypothetical protein
MYTYTFVYYLLLLLLLFRAAVICNTGEGTFLLLKIQIIPTTVLMYDVPKIFHISPRLVLSESLHRKRAVVE